VAVKTYPFDGSEFLEDPQSQAELIADALATGNAGYVAHALGVVARARGMTQVAKDAGLSRESLYKALSADGNPELATILQVAKALNVTLSASADKAAA
jgi:probable addiction module antidote protein